MGVSSVFSNIISTHQLRSIFLAPKTVVLDCRFDLKNPNIGEEAYRSGHIPGAQYVHLERDLCSPVGPETGRHPLASIEKLEQLFSKLGVGSDTQVVCYDAQDSMFAARCWWTLRYLGHERVCVLDGGLQAWIRECFILETGMKDRPSVPFKANIQTQMLVETRDVELQKVLLDSRDPQRFKGEEELIDPIAGHIPNAKNLPFKSQLNERGQFRPKDEILKNIQLYAKDDAPTFYCGSGVTACVNVLAADYVGVKGAKLYLGSWSEWIRDPKRSIAKGA